MRRKIATATLFLLLPGCTSHQKTEEAATTAPASANAQVLASNPTVFDGSDVVNTSLVTLVDSQRTPANYVQTPDGYEYVIPDKREFQPNTSISPCSNFYEHVCSNEIKGFTLRPDRSSHIFSLSDANERIFKKKKDFFKGIEHEKFHTEFGPMLQHLYAACMNEDAAKADELANVNSLRDLLKKPAKREDLFQTLMSLSENGVGGIFGFTITANQDDPNKYDVVPLIDATTLPAREYYEKKEVLDDYTALVTEFFNALGASDSQARAQRMVEFETRLGLTMLDPAKMRERRTEKSDLSADQFLKLYPNLKLSQLSQKWPKKTIVQNMLREMFEFMNHEWPTANLETLRDLAIFHNLSELMDDVFPQYMKAKVDFNRKHFGGPPERSARPERCASFISGSFSMELDAEMLPRLFPDFPSQRFMNLSERIRGAIVAGLKANSWLSPEARTMAITKITTAKLRLIQPTRQEDWGFSPKANYFADRHTTNKLVLARVKAKELVDKLQKPRNRDQWKMPPLMVNAQYSPSDNIFTMPIGVLQPPLFDASRTDEENIASVGTIMGHELGHGIDDQGSKFDDKGRLVQWMTDADLAEFKRRSSSLVEQFNQAGHNGQQTLGENIGDGVGLTFSYQAAFPEGKGSIELKQKFFKAYAQVWCQTATESAIKKKLKTDVHSLGWARVNEQVKHQPGFAEAFNCQVGTAEKPGDAMTLPPEKRVRIW
jgi:putative endopeptidase